MLHIFISANFGNVSQKVNQEGVHAIFFPCFTSSCEFDILDPLEYGDHAGSFHNDRKNLKL